MIKLLKNAILIVLWLQIFQIHNITEGQLLTTFNLPKWNSPDYIKNNLDEGQLFLTPLIQAGRHGLARKYAQVDGEHFFNVTSYSGMLQINNQIRRYP